MFAGVLALLERSLRVDSRALGPHLARFGLMVAIYFTACQASSTSWRFGAPGLRFFTGIAYLNLIFMTLLGVGFFSTVITEEKEEDTLGLMAMAGISPLGIILGKSLGRLTQALILMLVQFPFTLLAITLGGITSSQLITAYSALLGYMVLLAAAGLFCSIIASRNRTASVRLIFLVFLYFLIPLVCKSPRLKVALSGFPPAQWIADSCIFLEMGRMLNTGFDEFYWNTPALTNTLLAACLFVVSWAIFPIAMREPSSDSQSRGFLPQTGRYRRLISPGRATTNPYVWKDFHFVGGGRPGMLIRVFLYVALYFVLYLITLMNNGNVGRPLTEIFLLWAIFGLTFDAAYVAARSLHDEIRGQTLSTLLMMPTSTAAILYSKAAGAFVGWLASALSVIVAIKILPEGPKCLHDLCFTGPPQAWKIFLFFTSFYILAPHMAAASAMFVRWGAVPVGLGLTFGLFVLSILFLQTVRVSVDSPIFPVITMMNLGLCAVCHLVIGLRAEAHSSR